MQYNRDEKLIVLISKFHLKTIDNILVIKKIQIKIKDILTSFNVDEKISWPRTGAGYGGGGVPGGVIRCNSLKSRSLCLTCLGGDRSFIDSEAIKRLLASDGDIAVIPNCSGLDFVRWCLLSALEALKLASWEN